MPDIEEPVVTPEAEAEAAKPRTSEEYEAEIRSLRREAANKRVKNNQLDAELEEFRLHKESQKTELQKATELATAMKKELADLRAEKAKTDIAKKVGLDPELADRIRGENEQEMMEDARLLAEKSRRIETPAGGREAVRAGTSTEDSFRTWVENQY